MIQVSSRQKNKTAPDSTPNSKQDKIQQLKANRYMQLVQGIFFFITGKSQWLNAHNQEETKKSNPYDTQNIAKSKRTRDTPQQ